LSESEKPYDLLIVGGGINGAGIARDAAGRGLRVALIEAGDLAGATSSASSKLIHGGLRYLEYYEFRLVRESLREREVLLRLAPHIVWPLRFVLPHHAGLRPAWFLRLGLFLYDHLSGRRSLAGTRTLDRRAAEMTALLPTYARGFAYSDCWVEDSRLVVLNAMDARARGATVLTRTRFLDASRAAAGWVARIQREGRAPETLAARGLVNAAGPWVADVLRAVGSPHANRTPRLVKGSHIVVKRLYEGAHCYTFQNADGRIVFAIPYEQDFTLIGTTDVPYHDDPRTPRASDAEIEYLCRTASEYLARPVTPADVVWTYSGVRPLYDSGETDASAVTRDYVFDLDRGDDGNAAPLLSIYGGKITTYRKLAEHALRDLAPALQFTDREWTAMSPLPGGDILHGIDFFIDELRRRHPFLDARAARRIARAYGTRCEEFLGPAHSAAALGRDYGYGVSEAELDYARRAEWAASGEDFLWRRSKLGLHLAKGDQAAIAAWFARAGAGF
jgi:glycerol-3-phosphate dehydrogenase